MSTVLKPLESSQGHKRPTLRQRARKRAKGRCVYCGRPVKKGTADHFVPLAAGGPSRQENLVFACTVCNGLKGDAVCETIEEARQLIIERRKQRILELRRMLKAHKRKLVRLGLKVRVFVGGMEV